MTVFTSGVAVFVPMPGPGTGWRAAIIQVSPSPDALVSMTELQDLVALLRADTPLILIETRDEARVVELFRQALSQVWRHMHRWSITEGLRRFDLDREDEPGGPADLSSTLDAIREATHRGVYLLFDAVPFMGAAITQRQVREILERRNSQPSACDWEVVMFI